VRVADSPLKIQSSGGVANVPTSASAQLKSSPSRELPHFEHPLIIY
jgi:hypothetical protein